MLHTQNVLGLVTGDTLTWNKHIDQLISRLNSAALLSRKALRILYIYIYSSYVHSNKSYSIFF